MAQHLATSSALNSNGHLHPPVRTEDHDQESSTSRVSRSLQESHNDESDWHAQGYSIQAPALPFDPSLLPHGRRSLSSIGFQAFSLGFSLALCFVATIFFIQDGRPIWRLPGFIACLSIFHFLEFWTTARFNMPAARASSFLLRNGYAYTFAHGLATIEIIVSNFFPSYQSFLVNSYTISIGLVVVILGQLLRNAAMAEAGTNFNHTVAKTKREGHVLVTTGVYGYLRHPSYCAFFWWALGTQVLVGNKVSSLGFLFILWNFFKRRIRAEERALIEFFGEDYEEYRKGTITGIPFVG